jgi:hypothetical protein
MAGAPAGVVDARVLLEVDGTTTRYERALAKIPGYTDASAKKAAEAWRRSHYTKIAKDIAGLDKLNQDATANMAKSWSDVGKKIAELAGGPFSKLGQVVFDLAPKASAAGSALTGMAVAGAGVGAVAVGMAAVAGIVKTLADEAVRAEANLIKAGEAAEIPAESRASLKEYRDATKDFATEIDFLKVEVGATVSGPLTDLTEILANVSKWLRIGKGDLEEEQVATAAWGAAMATVNPIGVAFLAMIDGQAKGTRALTTETKKLTESQLDYMQSQAEIDDEARRNNAGRAVKQIAEAKKAAEAQALADIALAERKGEQLERIYETSARKQAAIDLKLAQERAEFLNEQREEEADWQAQLAENRLDTEQANADLRVAIAEDEATRKRAAEASWAAAAADLQRERVEAAEQAAEQMREAEMMLARSTVDGLGVVIDAAQEAYKGRGEQARQHARFLAGAEKAMAITAIGIDTAAAIMQGFAMFGPPPSPAGIFAAASAGIAGVAQVAAVNATPMPSFFGGGRTPGVSGEASPAMLHGKETTVNSMASDNWGDDFIAAMNNGLKPLQGLQGGNGGGDVYLDGVKVGRVLAKQRRNTAAVGFVSPFGRR